MKRLYIAFVVFILYSISADAQDIHYAQFYLSPMNQNPALTGVFSGDIRFAANYRSQWFSIPVPYTTTSGSVDGRILGHKTKDNILGASLLLNYDQAGDSRMGLMQVGGALAYAQRLSKNNFLSFGAQVSTAQRRFHTDKLTFDSQFNGDTFDPDLSTQEDFPNTSFFYLDLSAGINWHFQVNERNKLDLGAALHHLTTPQQSFFDNRDIRLARKYSVSGEASFRIAELVDLMPSFLFQRQGTYQEIVTGLGMKYHLSNEGKKVGLIMGTSYRPGDAVIPFVGMQYTSLRVGVSYDVNISPLKIASQKNGGPEIGLIYIITKVDPGKEFKSCPIF